MPSIGGFSVTAWPRGRLSTSSVQVARLDPWPGIVGCAYAVGANQAPESECETGVDLGTSRPTAENIEARYKALKGTGVLVVDSVGKTWQQVMVLDVATEIRWNSATNQWRLVAVWRLHPQSSASRS